MTEDGSYGLGPKVLGTPLAWLDSGSFYDENFDKFRSNVELAFTPVKGLTLKAIGGYNYTGQQIRHYRSAMEITGGKKLGPSSYRIPCTKRSIRHSRHWPTIT